MKIISKFKDNYGFMVSKYGLDETLVYDRRNSTPVGAYEKAFKANVNSEI